MWTCWLRVPGARALGFWEGGHVRFLVVAGQAHGQAGLTSGHFVIQLSLCPGLTPSHWAPSLC